MTAPDAGDGARFAFTAESLEKAKTFIARYPEGRQASAVIELLRIAQAQNGGWLSRAAIEHVAEVLDMPNIRVLEVATFYTMFNLKPVGRYLVQLCRTTPCWLRGGNEVRDACREFLGIEVGETTNDGLFTLVEVECLGACCNAPMMQINDDFYEDLDAAATRRVLEALKEGKTPPPGSQIGRKTSEPVTGPTTLLSADAEGAS